MLKDKLHEDMKGAMKSGERLKLETLRMLIAGIKNHEIESRKPAEDSEVLTLLRKASKSRRDAIEEFKKGGRNDLVEKETQEIAIIESYLPAALSEDEMIAIIDQVITQVNPAGMKDMGKVMKESLTRLAGRADGGAINRLVKDRLSRKFATV